MKRSKFVRYKDVETMIQLWGWMDDIILKIKNKKVISYWKKKGIPLKDDGEPFRIKYSDGKIKPLSYNDIIWNRYWWKDMFQECNFDKIWECFRHCICMSVDKDVPEYLNSLRVMEQNNVTSIG